MAYPTDVKIFWCEPGMTSVSTLKGGTGGRGTITSIFDACLVNGYGNKTASSLVVQDGIATASFNGPHEFGKWQVVQVSGAAYSPLNGEKRVLSANPVNGTITFDAEGIPNGADSGTVEVKVAPLGWLKPFSATNKSVYKINTAKYPEASDQYLRIDDSGGTYTATVACYESMTDVDTGTNRFPTVGQSSTGYFLSRSNESNTNNRYWVLIGDGRCFYFLNHTTDSVVNNPEYGAFVNFFGDPLTADESDPYKFTINGFMASDSGYSASYSYSFGYSLAVRCRAANRITRATGVTVTGGISNITASGCNSSSTSEGFPFPNTQDGAIQLTQRHLREDGNNNAYLGKVIGLLQVENRIGNKIHSSRLQRIYDSNCPAFPGKVIGYFLTVYSGTNPGVTAFDIIGPWR